MTTPERDPAAPVTAWAPKAQAADDVVLFEGQLLPVHRTERDDPLHWLCEIREERAQYDWTRHQFNGTRDILPLNVAGLSLLERHLRLATMDDVRHALRAKVRVYVAKRRALPLGQLIGADPAAESAYREAIEAQAYQNGNGHPSP